MKTNFPKASYPEIERRIYTIRGVQVMLDEHLAILYGVEIRILNQAVKRNMTRFPPDFMFQLTAEEWVLLKSQMTNINDSFLRSQNVTLEDNRGKHRKYLPYVFSEQGVAMLSSILRSESAIKVSIRIMQAFVEMQCIAS